MNRFVCSDITKKTIHFQVQILDFSKYTCKGYYTSPEFGKDECESQWGLLVHVYDGAAHENFIDVRLQRHDHATEVQFVSVKTSIVNCFGFNVLKDERKILFGSSNEAQILAVVKEQLKGLKRHFYLPKDTLTLQCDLFIHESSVSAYKKKEYLLNNTSQNEKKVSNYFAHSRLVEKAEDYFIRKITNFSVQSCGGCIITPEFQSESLGGKWSLIVCKATDYNSSEYLDIRLACRDSFEQQLVKISLSITDPLHKELLSKEKFAYFTSSGQVQLLSSTETVISNWYGKKQLIPDDTLTLRCKMVLYEQIDYSFDRKEDFDSGVKTFGYALLQIIPYIVAICFILPVVSHIFYCLCLSLLSYIWYTMQSVYETIKSFLFAVFAIAWMFSTIKVMAEKIIRRKKDEEIKKKLREEKKKMMLKRYREYGTDNYVNNYLYYRKQTKHSNQGKKRTLLSRKTEVF